MLDVAIVGGSVAGASLGVSLARRGLAVALFDTARFPRPKPRGEVLLPHGVAALSALGLAPPPFPRIRGFRIVSRGGEAVEADFPEGHGIAVERARFDARLLSEARADEGIRDRSRRIGLSTRARGMDVGERVEIQIAGEGMAPPFRAVVSLFLP
jgi:flavin-dependent dehydrogenase